MLSWQCPYIFVLLPVPLLARWLMPQVATATGAIRVPFYQRLHDLVDEQSQYKPSRAWLQAGTIWLMWCCLVTAAARPSWVGDPVILPQEKRDLMLAVDISRSMLEQDMLIDNRYTDRITSVKAVVGDFVKQRAGDRLGLILFGQQSYLQTPLTYDTKTVNQQLQEAQSGFAGNATAIGDTIGLAIKRLRDRPTESRVLILLTDGANSAGADPMQAADIAAEAGIRIHTVGIGADIRYVRDVRGQTRAQRARNDLDEQTMINIAEKTGGMYFRARDPEELQRIYAELDRIEPIPNEQTFRPTRSLSYWPTLLALLLSFLLAYNLKRSGT